METTVTTDDGDLIDIKGVGPKTAEQLKGAGFGTKTELLHAYLTNEAGKVEDVIYDVSAFRSWVRDQTVSNADLGVEGHRATDVAGMMLLARASEVSPRWLEDGVKQRSHVELKGTNPMRSTSIVGASLRPQDIDYQKPCVVTADGEVGYGPSTPAPAYAEAQYESVVDVENEDTDYVTLHTENNETTVDEKNLDAAEVVLGYHPLDAPEEIEVAEDHTPLRIEYDGVNRVRVAPFLPT